MSDANERSDPNARAANAFSERLTFEEAAVRMNVSRDAVRMRVHRGSLATILVDGRTFVVWPQPDPAERTHDRRAERTRSERRAPVQNDDRLVAALEGNITSLQNEVQHLRDELSIRTEELRRKDHLLAAALERIPELPATVTDADAPENAIPAPLRGAVATEAAEPLKPASDGLALAWRRWWRRMTGE